MNSEKLNRRKKVGGPSNDPTNITYGRANPFEEQGPNNVDTDPRVAASFNAQMPGMDGMARNPYGDAVIQTPALGAPSGQPSPAGGIASFSGNMQKDVPGTKLNQTPGAFIPSINQSGSSDATDQQEGSRLAFNAQRLGLIAGAMGPINVNALSVAPGGSMPANIQTAGTLPLMGPQGGINQSNAPTNRKRGQRDGGGITT